MIDVRLDLLCVRMEVVVFPYQSLLLTAHCTAEGSWLLAPSYELPA